MSLLASHGGQARAVLAASYFNWCTRCRQPGMDRALANANPLTWIDAAAAQSPPLDGTPHRDLGASCDSRSLVEPQPTIDEVDGDRFRLGCGRVGVALHMQSIISARFTSTAALVKNCLGVLSLQAGDDIPERPDGAVD